MGKVGASGSYSGVQHRLRGSTPKPGMHSSYLKAKRRNNSGDAIKRCLIYINSVQVLGWKENIISATDIIQKDPYQHMHCIRHFPENPECI